MKTPYKIIFMGTPEFAVPCLERLVSDGYEVLCVVTQPDRKKGRRGGISYSPVKIKALENNIEVLQPENIKSSGSVTALEAVGADLFITCAYGQILSQKVLDIPSSGCINVHASLLPEYRGAAPIQRAVMNGDKITGITTMMTDRGMDTGDILLKKEIEISESMTSGELHDILRIEGAGVLSETLQKLSEGTVVGKPQDGRKATYAPMLRKEESIIDWNDNSFRIHNKVRALDPWPGCFTSYKGRRLRITGADYSKDITECLPGSIISVDREYIKVACKEGILKIYELQFENGKKVNVSQCWHNIDGNEILGRKD